MMCFICVQRKIHTAAQILHGMTMFLLVGKLCKYLETMCKETGIKEKKTNHSLRATGASALFAAGVQEKIIHDITGHRSSALQLYERPTAHQRKEVSKVLVQGRKSFNEESSDKDEKGSIVAAPNQFSFSSLEQCNVHIHVGSAQQLLDGVNKDK